MRPERWPDLDWEGLAERHCLQKEIFDQRVPPAQYPTFEGWQEATQAYQARLVQAQVEALRRLRSGPVGGFAVFCLSDAQPAVSSAVLDHERKPKAAYAALRAACAPVLVVADWPASSYAPSSTLALDVHVVNDLVEALAGAEVEATLKWPGGGRRWHFSGAAGGRACSFVGRLKATLPAAATLPSPGGGPNQHAGAPRQPGDDLVTVPSWPLVLDLRLRWVGSKGPVANRYESWISL
jgi:beta-mannosidase